MADQNHSLARCRVTVILDDRFEQLNEGICGIGIPIPGCKLGDAASWEVDC
jgi:hypothetical protein